MNEKIILKILLITHLIWFLTFIITGFALKPKFKKAQQKLNKALKEENISEFSYFKTIVMYFIISMIPIVRLHIFIGKMLLIFDTKEYIKHIKEIQKKIRN